MPNGYRRAWREYRKRELLALGAIIALIVVPFVVGALTTEGYGRNIAISLLMLMLGAAVLVFGYRLVFWPCPRCRKTFRGLSNRCFHCGLPVWSDHD